MTTVQPSQAAHKMAGRLRVFLCHSSADKALVEEIHAGLGPDVAWLDTAEVEWGDILLEKIAAAVEEATDFVLFWSKAASQSNWVRFETHMGFIRFLEQSGCKLRVVLLDKTPLPLYLKPFLFLDVSDSLGEAPSLIVERLVRELPKPRASIRRLLLDRHDELGRIELAIDSGLNHVLLVQGIQGIGKRTLVGMAAERFFAPPDVRAVVVRPGTGWVELALQLAAIAGLPPPEEGAPRSVIEDSIKLAIEATHNTGTLLGFYEIEHWIEEGGEPSPILQRLLDWFLEMPALARRPIFMTSTRVPRLLAAQRGRCQLLRIEGLPSEHLAALIQHWLQIEKGQSTDDRQALARLCGELYGYPLAARIAASLVAHYGVQYLLEYPRQVVELRVDIAKDVVAATKLSSPGYEILQALAVLDAPVPGSYIASALDLDQEKFREGVNEALSWGLASTEGLSLRLHPLVRDFYWRGFSLSPTYRSVLHNLARDIRSYLNSLAPGSEEYAVLLPTVFRVIALTGDLEGARSLRRDLMGTLVESGIQLYHRREYNLALKYLTIVLDEWPEDWDARLYQARCLARTGKTRQARDLLSQMKRERPSSVPVLHALGRTQMEDKDWRGALLHFADALAQWRGHVPSLRDSAECYVQLGDLDNGEGFVRRAKEIEPTNAYVLQIESIISERRGLFEDAYQAMTKASAQDPKNGAFEHRLGRIAEQQQKRQKALEHYERAVQLDEGLIEAHLSRASVLVDLHRLDEAKDAIDAVRGRAHGGAAPVLANIEGRLAYARDELDQAMQLVRGSRDPSAYALRAKVEMRRAGLSSQQGYSQLARQSLAAARGHITEGLDRHPGNQGLLDLEQELLGLENRSGL